MGVEGERERAGVTKATDTIRVKSQGIVAVEDKGNSVLKYFGTK